MILKVVSYCMILSVAAQYVLALKTYETLKPHSSIPNSYQICRGNSTSYESKGTLTNINYDGYYYGPAQCYFYIYAPLGYYAIQIRINKLDIADKYHGYIKLSTSNIVIAELTGDSYNGYLWQFLDNVEVFLYLGSNYGVNFLFTWNFLPTYPISPPLSSECEGPDILFLLDRSQAILPDFYNSSVKSFIRNVTSKYSFIDDVTIQNPFSSRFGIIEFSDEASVTVPLKQYNRADFFWKIEKNVNYGNGGTSNVTAALLLAYNEFVAHVSPSNSSYQVPRIIVLIVNDISRFHFNQTLAAMNKLKKIVQLPTGVIVPGLPGIPNGAQKRLADLIGNVNYAFGSLAYAVTEIPFLSNSTFTCPICGNLVFICETTVAIGYDAKLLCLQLSQRLAMATADNNKKKYAIALYGVQVYNDIELQTFDEFNKTINSMIDNVETNDLPNGGQTFLAPILNQLYNTLNKNDTTSKAYVFTLIMGELSAIRDPSPANTAAQNVASMKSDIYVLDQSRYGLSSTLWTTLTSNQPNHIVNGTTSTDIDSLFAKFETTLLRDYSKVHC
jgi:hypothetical protein